MKLPTPEARADTDSLTSSHQLRLGRLQLLLATGHRITEATYRRFQALSRLGGKLLKKRVDVGSDRGQRRGALRHCCSLVNKAMLSARARRAFSGVRFDGLSPLVAVTWAVTVYLPGPATTPHIQQFPYCLN